MNISLGLLEIEQSDLIIQGIENGTAKLGEVNPRESKEFVLKLFALRLGIVPMTGLSILERLTGIEIVVKQKIC